MTATEIPATILRASTIAMTSPEGGEGASAPRRRRITKSPEQALMNVRMLGRTLDDLEKVRKSLGNRVGAMKRAGIDGTKDVDLALGGTEELEHSVTLMLKRAWRQHPLAPWAEMVPGVGEKSIARLVSEIGEPTVRRCGEGKGTEWRYTHDEARTLAQLRSYCGHGDPARKKKAGMSQADAFAMGNPTAKMRVYLIAEAAIKQRCAACVDQASLREDETGYAAPPADCSCSLTHPLRHVYDTARAKYAARVYDESTAKGKAKPGDPWVPAHQHQAALREVGKEFLRLLHAEATRLA